MNYGTRLFVLLGLLSGVLSRPDNKQWTFSYNGNITVHSSITDDVASLWGVYAQLTVQELSKDLAVAQLTNVETIAYNGFDPEHANISPIAAPAEASVLGLSFKIHYKGGLVDGISHNPQDVLWSINMKRAIASTLQADDSLPSTVTEKHVYGSCDVQYTHKRSDDKIILNKLININECKGEINKSWQNVESFACNDFESTKFQRNATRVYTIEKKNNQWTMTNIICESDVFVRTMPTESIHSKLKQRQEYNMMNIGTIQHPIDVSASTVRVELDFELTDDLSGGRNVASPNEVTSDELVEQWNMNAEKLKEQWNSNTATHVDLDSLDDYIENMYSIMENMDVDDYKALFINIASTFDMQKLNMFTSLLPIIGNKASLQVIKFMLEDKYQSQFLAMKMLATFPPHVSEYSEELLVQMDFLTELENMGNTGLLSFATLVGDAYTNKKCSQETYDRHVNSYYTKFLTHTDYNKKLAYLQGLHNLQVDSHILQEFINNKNNNHHLRTYAIQATKEKLKQELGKSFQLYYPILIDEENHFDVRVAALDVILDTPISNTDFQQLVDHIKEDANVRNQHLYNYFYTAFEAVDNETACQDSLSTFTQLFDLEEPETDKSWITGKYRGGFTDEGMNHGIVSELQLVGDPETNIINSLHLKLERFVMSLKYTSFSIYLKIEGLADEVFDRIFLSKIFSIGSVPELLEILQRTHLKIRPVEKAHIDLIVYTNDKAVLATHIDLEKDNEMMQQLSMLMAEPFLYQGINYPIVDYTYTTSDLGTVMAQFVEVKTSYLNDIAFQDGTTIKHKNYRLSKVEVQTTNPIDYNHFGVTKYHSSRFTGQFKFYQDKYAFTWNDTEENPYIKFVDDRFVYTFATDEENLHHHCASCQIKVDVTEREKGFTHKTHHPLAFIGKDVVTDTFNCTSTQDIKEQMKVYLTPKYIYNGFEVAQPVLAGLFVMQGASHLNTINSCNFEASLVSTTPVPTSSRLEFVNNSSRTKINDPLVRSGDNFSISFEQKAINGPLVRYWSVFLDLEDTKESTSKFHVRVHSAGENYQQLIKLCLDGEVTTPANDPDMNSIQLTDPTTITVNISLGPHIWNNPSCPQHYKINAAAIFTVLEEQRMIAANASEEPFKTCREESKYLKYVAPTESCLQASEMVSTYRNYHFQIGTETPNPIIKNIADSLMFYMSFGVLDDSVEIVPYNDVGNMDVTATFHYAEPKFDLTVNNVKRKFVYDDDYSDMIESLLVDSRNELQNYELIELGIQSSCIITPNFVKTYSGKVYQQYESNFNVQKLGYIECTNQTRFGLVFNRRNETQVSFTMWSQDNKYEVLPTEGGVQITLNGEKFSQGHSDQVKFLADDVVLIQDSLQSVYYNKEYIHITTYSVHMKSMCGLCGLHAENINI